MPSQNGDQPRTTGTATSRARQVRPAVRRPTKARLAMSGPSGSGKTWTAMSVAEVLAPRGRYIVIDTERGDDDQSAAELYADTFQFQVLEWTPPYDPRDLAITLDDLSQQPDDVRPDVVVVDSASHFWRGEGGTLDIAGGKFGGWKVGTPAQEELVQAILRAGYHIIVCTRARQDYVVDEDASGKQKVTKLGLAPVQRDDLEYEFQVVVQLDMDHRIDVGKTRAQPLAGGSWPAGQQARFAGLYKSWLDSGVQLARQVDVDALRDMIRLAELGPQWQAAGFPRVAHMDADQLPAAWTWLGAQLGVDPHPAVVANDDPELCATCGASLRAYWHVTDHSPTVPPPVAVPDAPPEGHPPAPAPEPEPEPEPDRAAVLAAIGSGEGTLEQLGQAMADAPTDARNQNLDTSSVTESGDEGETAEPEPDPRAEALASVAATLAD